MFGFNMFSEPLRPFDTIYRCFSITMFPGAERQDVEKGGKIIMPPSALDHLTRLNIVYPMLFKLTNVRTNRETHCGVLEFVADEGKVYLPYWMMKNLLLEEGDMIKVESTSLPVATFSKFQPQSVDFLDITNPKAVLENALRNFACLTTGDVIAISYNNKLYELCVLETRPGLAVTIIECDMNVEFAPPIGYKDPSTAMESSEEPEKQEGMQVDFTNRNTFVAFAGEGKRLDGKNRVSTLSVKSKSMKGIPDFDYQFGRLTFIRTTKSPNSLNNQNNNNVFTPFEGPGRILTKK